MIGHGPGGLKRIWKQSLGPEKEGSQLKWKGGEDEWEMQRTWRQKGRWKVKSSFLKA